jgi:hypothetical protein
MSVPCEHCKQNRQRVYPALGKSIVKCKSLAESDMCMPDAETINYILRLMGEAGAG